VKNNQGFEGFLRISHYYESLLITHITDIIIKDLKDFKDFFMYYESF